jgi:hypothetical protein
MANARLSRKRCQGAMMSESGLVLKEAMLAVRRAMKERGFSSKGFVFFHRIEGGNIVVLALQKSTRSTSATTEVTVNYGTYSVLLGARLQEDVSSANDITKAHWRNRLSEGGREIWLPVAASDSPDACARLILDQMERVIAQLLLHSTDAQLRDTWLAGSSPGLTHLQRLLYAAILVNELGPAESLAHVVAELRRLVGGGVHEGLVERQLSRAGVEVTVP